MNPKELGAHEFEALRRYIHNLCGLYIQDEKRYLIQQRLSELVEATGCGSFAGFIELLSQRPTQDLHDQIIACMTTNETSFFRDKHPFDVFAGYLLPELADRLRREYAAGKKPEPARIWCTAVSTGQEAYSLAMLIQEYIDSRPGFAASRRDFRILGTDVSSRVLHRAIAGVYNEVEMARGVSPERRERFFIRRGKQWEVRPELREMVDFRKVNLASPAGIFVEFEVIFCRNVLIYFDDDTKRIIAEMLHRRLKDNGVLILGSAENLYNITEKFHSEQVDGSIVYRKG
jgi:chemotaxis protein methyltransferase CheR